MKQNVAEVMHDFLGETIKRQLLLVSLGIITLGTIGCNVANLDTLRPPEEPHMGVVAGGERET